MYTMIRHKENKVVDNFIADNNLFAIFEAPCHVLFIENFIKNMNRFKDVFSRYNMGDNIFFSCKANKALSFLYYASKNDCGIEVSSLYELRDALKYTKKIIATGPGKSREYLQLAIANDVIISVDDIQELEDIIAFSKPVKVFLRIANPINLISRFGINKSDLSRCINLISNSSVKIVGLAFHINNYSLNDRVLAIKECLKMIRENNLLVEYIDIGGGVPISYCSKEEWNNFIKNNQNVEFFGNKKFNSFYPYYNEICAEKFIEEIFNQVKGDLGNIKIISELGRSLLDNCGITVFEVQYLKKLPNNEMLIVTNGNINDLSEQWFNTDYLIEPTLLSRNKVKNETVYAPVAGNLCLEQDMITWRKIKFETYPMRGDYLIYHNTAGYQMDSNESTFHKIPILTKYVLRKEKNKNIIEKDENYDC